MLAVLLAVAHVVDQIGGARDHAQDHQRTDGLGGDHRPIDPAGRTGGREHQHVLPPLTRPARAQHHATRESRGAAAGLWAPARAQALKPREESSPGADSSSASASSGTMVEPPAILVKRRKPNLPVARGKDSTPASFNPHKAHRLSMRVFSVRTHLQSLQVRVRVSSPLTKVWAWPPAAAANVRLASAGQSPADATATCAGLMRLRRIALVAALVALVPVVLSYWGTMSEPSNSSLGIRSVEWLRDNGAAGLVARVESVYYTLTAPSKGGPTLRALPKVGYGGSVPPDGQRRSSTGPRAGPDPARRCPARASGTPRARAWRRSRPCS